MQLEFSVKLSVLLQRFSPSPRRKYPYTKGSQRWNSARMFEEGSTSIDRSKLKFGTTPKISTTMGSPTQEIWSKATLLSWPSISTREQVKMGPCLLAVSWTISMQACFNSRFVHVDLDALTAVFDCYFRKIPGVQRLPICPSIDRSQSWQAENGVEQRQ